MPTTTTTHLAQHLVMLLVATALILGGTRTLTPMLLGQGTQELAEDLRPDQGPRSLILVDTRALGR